MGYVSSGLQGLRCVVVVYDISDDDDHDEGERCSGMSLNRVVDRI